MGYAITAGLPALQWNADQIALMKSTICKGSTDEELGYAIMVCQRMGLDPFAKQIWVIKRWSASEKKEVMAFQTSIDGYRICAERTGKYLGQDSPQWCGEDGIWREVWLSSAPPVAARVAVYKKGLDHPIVSIAHWSEYKQTKQDGSTNSMWTKMPALMLSKCAEALALRKAFPYEMSGVYTAEEQENNELKDVTPPEQRPRQAAPRAAQQARQPEQLKNAAPAQKPAQRAMRPGEAELLKEIGEWCTAVGKTKEEWGKTFTPGKTWAQIDYAAVLAEMLVLKNGPPTDDADLPAFSEPPEGSKP